MHKISPKIFAKLDFLATMSQTGVALYALKIFWAFQIFFQLCLAYPILEVLEIWKKKHKVFRVKNNLAVLLLLLLLL